MSSPWINWIYDFRASRKLRAIIVSENLSQSDVNFLQFLSKIIINDVLFDNYDLHTAAFLPLSGHGDQHYPSSQAFNICRNAKQASSRQKYSYHVQVDGPFPLPHRATNKNFSFEVDWKRREIRYLLMRGRKREAALYCQKDVKVEKWWITANKIKHRVIGLREGITFKTSENIVSLSLTLKASCKTGPKTSFRSLTGSRTAP